MWRMCLGWYDLKCRVTWTTQISPRGTQEGISMVQVVNRQSSWTLQLNQPTWSCMEEAKLTKSAMDKKTKNGFQSEPRLNV